MRSLAQNIKAEDMPPLIHNLIVFPYAVYFIYSPATANVIHVIDRSLARRLKMRREIFPR